MDNREKDKKNKTIQIYKKSGEECKNTLSRCPFFVCTGNKGHKLVEIKGTLKQERNKFDVLKR